MRANDLVSPFRGIRMHRSIEMNLDRRCQAYSLRLADRQAFSHSTAALLYGLPVPLYLHRDPRIHVSVAAGMRPSQDHRIVGHEIGVSRWDARTLSVRDDSDDVIFDLPIISPCSAWAQLAASLDIDDLVALGDAIVGGEAPLATIDQIWQVTDLWSGRRGARSMRHACTMIRVDSRSRPESLHRLHLVRAGIPEPELNREVRDQRGGFIGIADEVWSSFRTLAEYEGDWHRTSRDKFRSDITRFERYADAGWSALRAHADDVFTDPNPFIGHLWRRLVSRGWVAPRAEPLRVARARR
jgi:hypothetical protein